MALIQIAGTREAPAKRPLFQGPDDAVRRWWHLTAREESASGRDPFLIKGSVAADECTACGHERHHEVSAKRGHGWIDRCMRCGAAWSSCIEYVLRGTIQVSCRPHELEDRLIDLADLEHAIDQLPDPEALLYGLYLITDRSYEYVAERATELALEYPHRWTKPVSGFTLKRVRGAVGRSRRLLSEALIARGLMARHIPVLMRDGSREFVDGLEPLPADVVMLADPATWSGLLQDLEISSEALRSRASRSTVTRLSRATTAELGTVYREVSFCMDRP